MPFQLFGGRLTRCSPRLLSPCCRRCWFPRLPEAFSLPLIEALACDTPVVASDLEVHREVWSGLSVTFLVALQCFSHGQDWLGIWLKLWSASAPAIGLGSEDYTRLFAAHYEMDFGLSAANILEGTPFGSHL